MIVKDGEATLCECLDSLISFDEVIVYINNSKDNSKEIASSYANTKVIDGEFMGFGQTKNLASSYSSNSWILSLDCDEVLSEEFVKNLSNMTLNIDTLYQINRTNYYGDIEIKYCWGDDIITRLYNKDKTKFVDNSVHEYVIEDGFAIEMLEGKVRHYPYSNISDFIVKLDRYSTIYANENVGKKSSSPLKAILNGLYSFIKTYFFKRGFLDGYAGLVIAFSHFATNFYKYIKLYELNRDLK
jgi:glycosyltransferase involved in cell wall biosynthesis